MPSSATSRKPRSGRAARPAASASPSSSSTSAALSVGRRVLRLEAEELTAVARRLDDGFARAVDLLAAAKGKIVVTGMGKSGLVGRKIAATLMSTGSPSVFLHAAEAAHGDAGVFVRGDAVLALSQSGETDEVVRLLPLFRRFGLPVVAITGGVRSSLARAADVVLDVAVSQEACPMGLAPTASTTAALAMGDALAVALLERRGFGPDDFAVLHPAGALGRRFLTVGELMHRGEDVPVVGEDTSFGDILVEITHKRLGVTAVVRGASRLVGVITDGDLRRAFERDGDVRAARARDLMSPHPKTVAADALAAHAVAEMERHSITCLFVTGSRGRLEGVIHLHDLLRAGVV